MKPSEAIRKGAKLTKGQERGVYYNTSTDRCCAIGAMRIGYMCNENATVKDKNIAATVDAAGEEMNLWDDYYREYGGTIQDHSDAGISLEEIADRLEVIGY